MTLHHLEIFAAVCRTMSMTRTAEELNMTQPAVSKTIRELEMFYHTLLFDRIGRRLYLTDAGQKLLSYTEEILARYKESVSLLRDGSSFTDCSLSVNLTVGESVLSDLCNIIAQENPAVSLHVSVLNVSSIAAQLKANTCDIAITDYMDEPFFSSEYLYSEQLSFYASDAFSPSRILSGDEFRSLRLLLREEGSGNRRAADSFLEAIDYPLSSAWIGSSDNVLLELAEAGLGAALLPDSCVSRLSDTRLHRIEAEGFTFQRKFYLVHMNNHYLNKGVLACMESIRHFAKCLTGTDRRQTAKR